MLAVAHICIVLTPQGAHEADIGELGEILRCQRCNCPLIHLIIKLSCALLMLWLLHQGLHETFLRNSPYLFLTRYPLFLIDCEDWLALVVHD